MQVVEAERLMRDRHSMHVWFLQLKSSDNTNPKHSYVLKEHGITLWMLRSLHKEPVLSIQARDDDVNTPRRL